jgi:non-specific serine/threonine protein kinase
MVSFRLGEHEVRPAERRVIARDGASAPLGARAFDLLLALIEHRGRVIGNDELLALVWPGVVVEENNLTAQISALRKLLGGDAIATLAGRGYRLVRAVTEVDAAASSPAAPTTAALAPVQGDAGASAAAPPRHNLPAERSSFVGREAEIARARMALAEHRLVTLTGIGGSGKTRLALRVASLESGVFADGVFFVDLAPVADPALVPQTLAAACGLMPGDSPAGAALSFTDRLVGVLAPQRCLLVVDNCEHLLDASAALVDRLLSGCARLSVLTTSREALGVEGEQGLPVPSLAVPAEGADPEVTDAMRLFADRARAVQPSFRLDGQSTAVVAEICRHLDGIPLAIEFAAARLSHLSAAQVAARLDDRFRLLTGGRRRVARQQTLAATLDWSHELLGAAEQALFRRLGVFAGGCRRSGWTSRNAWAGWAPCCSGSSKRLRTGSRLAPRRRFPSRIARGARVRAFGLGGSAAPARRCDRRVPGGAGLPERARGLGAPLADR